jgi:uncharacterized protein YlxW (UPF0749 family)
MRLSGRWRVSSWQMLLALALFSLGLLIAAQVRAQAPAAQYSSLEKPNLIQTIEDLQQSHDTLADDIVSLRNQIAAVRQTSQGGQTGLVAINQQLQQAQLAAGFTTVQGAGGYLYVDDGTPPAGSNGNAADYRINATDVRTLVLGLWRCGASAISVNGERIVTTTAFLDVGGSVLVNSAYVTDGTGQYTIAAIGPADMWTRLSALDSFTAWMGSRHGPYHLTIQFVDDPNVVVLGYAGSANLHVARPSVAPSASPVVP